MTPVLMLDNVAAGYGRGDIIQDISFGVNGGEIVTVIGPNGAGKSTLIKTVAGVVRPSRGTITTASNDDGSQTMINGLKASDIARLGMAYVPQESNVFRQLSVLENLAMGAWTVAPQQRAERIEQGFALFPALQEKRRQRAGNLSGGQRQMVAFAMALMTNPRVLLLDEPSAGLSPKLIGQLFDTVRQVNERGIAVLMVEQNAVQALSISHRGIVMAGGRIQISAEAQTLLNSPDVAELYLGVGSR